MTIFICYRREDSRYQTDSIYRGLVPVFGKKNVFKDVDSMPDGVNFPLFISEQLDKCLIVLVVIGKYWLKSVDENNHPRIKNSEDFVRIEISTAIKKNICIIPILVDDAQMPAKKTLPLDIQELAVLNARIIRPDPDFDSDIRHLIKNIRLILRRDRKWNLKSYATAKHSPFFLLLKWSFSSCILILLLGLFSTKSGIYIDWIPDSFFPRPTVSPTSLSSPLPSIGGIISPDYVDKLTEEETKNKISIYNTKIVIENRKFYDAVLKKEHNQKKYDAADSKKKAAQVAYGDSIEKHMSAIKAFNKASAAFELDNYTIDDIDKAYNSGAISKREHSNAIEKLEYLHNKLDEAKKSLATAQRDKEDKSNALVAATHELKKIEQDKKRIDSEIEDIKKEKKRIDSEIENTQSRLMIINNTLG